MLAIIVRRSKEDEGSNSIDNQLREGKEFAKSIEEPYLLYNEGEGVSGGLPIDKRPLLKKLISDIETGIITKLWFRDQNRIERNSLTFHIIADVIRKNKTQIYFGNNKKIDLNDANEFFNSSLMSLMNSYQINKQSQQTKKALQDNARLGKVHSILAYGYTKDENRIMMIDDEEAEVVKRVYEMSLSGIGARSICKILNDEGVETRYKKMGKRTYTRVHKDTGKTKVYDSSNCIWTQKTILNLIKSPVYKGIRTFSGVQYKCPAIVTPDYWQKVNDNLKKNKNNSGKKVDHKYLLKGLLECSYCNRNYYGKRRTNLRKANYYMCSGKRFRDNPCTNRGVNIDQLNDLIWYLFHTDEDYKNLVKQAISEDFDKENFETTQKEVEAIKKGLKALDNERERAISLTIKGTLTHEDVRSELDRIKREKSDYENKLIDFNEVIKRDKENKNLVRQIDKDFSTAHKSATFDEKRSIIHKYIKRIYINYITHRKIYEIKIETRTNTSLVEVLCVDSTYNVVYLVRNHKLAKLKENVKESKVFEIMGRIKGEIPFKIV